MSTLPERPHQEGTKAATGPPAWTYADAVPKRFGDFEVISKLGQGSFGQVFLARQVSLERHVALKVMDGEPTGHNEGQVLAGLEHDHIVKVYSAFLDPPSGLSGLCLQYVPGADLGVIIRRVFEGGRVPESGRALLDALDQLRRGDPGFDPAALRDREALEADDFPQAVCRLGGRMAEALAFAHANGILHCDIKPGNILLTPYGRPMLADFNVAFDRTRHNPEDTRYGGTLAYMAPEYRAVMLNLPGGKADERCDVYSLGVVLYELATGTRPTLQHNVSETKETVAQGTVPARATLPEVRTVPDAMIHVPRELAAVICRAIDPEPTHRYQTATELATALASARQLLTARRTLPAPSPIGRWATAFPLYALAVAGILPHVIASLVQISYNTVEVRLTTEQGTVFAWLVIVYNLIAYPVFGGTALYLFRQVKRQLPKVATMSGPELDAFRGQVCQLCWRAAALGAIGWFPGALIFPIVIDTCAGPIPWQLYAHYFISFSLGGLIGVVFSYLSIAYVVLRALYPQLGNADTYTPTKGWNEVYPLTAPFGAMVTLASGVPLVGAVLLLTLADTALTLGFRVLVAGLIGAGVAGVGLAERIVRRLHLLAAVWQKDAEAR